MKIKEALALKGKNGKISSKICNVYSQNKTTLIHWLLEDENSDLGKIQELIKYLNATDWEIDGVPSNNP